MDDKLATPASQLKFRILFSRPGELRLEDGFIAFTSGGGDLVFRAPLQEARASFPKVTSFFGIPTFGTGINLAAGGNTYRFSFLPYKYGWGSVPGGGGIGLGWSFSGQDVKQGRAAVRQWRAALGLHTNRGH
jgi:hypothetical protein